MKRFKRKALGFLTRKRGTLKQKGQTFPIFAGQNPINKLGKPFVTIGKGMKRVGTRVGPIEKRFGPLKGRNPLTHPSKMGAPFEEKIPLYKIIKPQRERARATVLKVLQQKYPLEKHWRIKGQAFRRKVREKKKLIKRRYREEVERYKEKARELRPRKATREEIRIGIARAREEVGKIRKRLGVAGKRVFRALGAREEKEPDVVEITSEEKPTPAEEATLVGLRERPTMTESDYVELPDIEQLEELEEG